jgi:hypothetical protein
MTTRAERRRTLRAAGQKRADGKRGRRGAIRIPDVNGVPYEAAMRGLYERGFTVAKPRIWTPEDAA